MNGSGAYSPAESLQRPIKFDAQFLTISDSMISRRILSERCALEEHKPNITKEKLLRKLNFVGDKSPETVIESMNDDGLSRMYEAYFMSYDQFCILIRWRSSTKPDGKGMQLVVEFLWLRSLCTHHVVLTNQQAAGRHDSTVRPS